MGKPQDRNVVLLPAFAVLATLGALAARPADGAHPSDRTGQEVFEANCASCHGPDGRGAARTQVGFEDPLPDFTDCNFATREPAADWVAIASEGGPVRGFSHTMPAFGGALNREELALAVQYIRGFCREESWPRGELNLPRAMFTEKAFPEDEAVWTVTSATRSPASFENQIVYENRIGSRSQWELVIPFGAYQRGSEEGGGWTGGFGDIALGAKLTVAHNLRSGSILSVAGEVILPLGDEDDGMGSGVTVFEPFLSFGQILPADAFFQFQAGTEISTDTGRKGSEAFWRGALGKSFVVGEFGRVWSPMVELLGARELENGAPLEWDLAPQFQVTLSTRQHIMGNIALRLPLTQTEERHPELLFYVLWDWFDGGLFEGW